MRDSLGARGGFYMRTLATIGALSALVPGVGAFAQVPDSLRAVTFPFAVCVHRGVVPPRSDTVYQSTDVDTLPRIVKEKPPSVPSSLRRTAGHTRLRVLVDTSGRLDPCHAFVVEETSAEWTTAVLKVLAEWRYTPGVRMGRRVPVWVELPVSYKSYR